MSPCGTHNPYIRHIPYPLLNVSQRNKKLFPCAQFPTYVSTGTHFKTDTP